MATDQVTNHGKGDLMGPAKGLRDRVAGTEMGRRRDRTQCR